MNEGSRSASCRWAEAGCPAPPRRAVPGLQQRRSGCGPGDPCSHGTEPMSTAGGHRWHQGHAAPLPASGVSIQNMFSRQEEKQLDRNVFLFCSLCMTSPLFIFSFSRPLCTSSHRRPPALSASGNVSFSAFPPALCCEACTFLFGLAPPISYFFFLPNTEEQVTGLARSALEKVAPVMSAPWCFARFRPKTTIALPKDDPVGACLGAG